MTEFTGLSNNLRACMDRERIPFAVRDAFALAAHGHPRYTPARMTLMLLCEATDGDLARAPEQLRDVEILARENELAWDEFRTWVEKMGHQCAYGICGSTISSRSRTPVEGL